MTRLDYIKDKLLLTDKELDEVILDKDKESMFAIYMATVNFSDYGYSIFVEHEIDMHTRLPDGREVSGCKCLYDVLLRTPFRHREDGNLFSFIKNSLILSRDLKEGELL